MIRDRDAAVEESSESPSWFSRTRVRVTIVLLVLGSLAALAMPSVMNTVRTLSRTTAALPSSTAPGAMATTATTAPAISTTAVTTTVPSNQSRSSTAADAAREEKSVRTVRASERSDSMVTQRASLARERDPESSRSGNYWIQVAALRDAEAAKHIAATLRDRQFPVAESTTTSTKPIRAGVANDRYEIVVDGAKDDLTSRLAPKGLTIDTTEDGLRVRPTLSLHDAVTVSKDLAGAGFQVQVKRAPGDASPAAQALDAAPEVTWYRVRVGPFADRATAQETLRKLMDRGYAPFIARGQE